MTPATLSPRPVGFPEGLDAAAAVLPRAAERVPAPRRTAQVLLLAMTAGATFRNYWTYSHYEHLDPSVWMSFVQGTGAAPEQYRVGVKLVAWWIMRHAGGGFRHSFALLDMVGATVAGLLLYALLERSPSYRDAGEVGRWMGSAVFLVLFFYYLSWLPWFEKAETLPSAGLVAGLLWLWTAGAGQDAEQRPSRAWLTGFGLLLLTVAQALVRADVAFAVSAGVFVVAASWRVRTPGADADFSIPRGWVMAVSGACAIVAAGTQLYMMRVAYPRASYGDTPVFMLRHDFAEPLVVGPFVLFLLPVAWTGYAAWQGLRGTGRAGNVAGAGGLAMLLAGLLYLPLWMVLGKLDEVRIFLPLALAMTPLTTELVLGRVARSRQDGDASATGAVVRARRAGTWSSLPHGGGS